MRVVAEAHMIESRQGICYRAGISATSESLLDGNHVGGESLQSLITGLWCNTLLPPHPHLSLKPTPTTSPVYLHRTDDLSVTNPLCITLIKISICNVSQLFPKIPQEAHVSVIFFKETYKYKYMR